MLKGPVFVRDYQQRHGPGRRDLRRRISPPSTRHRPPDERTRRPILSPERTLGSVIQLLTPSPEYTDEHNAWLARCRRPFASWSITVKRYYRPEWGEDWREHFTVDRINGFLGHELKFDNQKLVSNYLRVGYDPDGSWRIYKLRPDFHPADKVQVEDDITASVVLPRESLNDLDPEYRNPSVKLVENCETLLFQRPDDAIHRGVDKNAEADIAGPGNFLSNLRAAHRRAGRATRRACRRVRRIHRADEAAARNLSPSTGARLMWSRPRIRAWSKASRPRIRAICRSGPIWRIRAKPISPKSRARLEREIPPDQPRAFSGQRRLAGPPQQSGRSEIGIAAARRLQPDPLSGTARAVHGVHLQPDRQIAVHHRLRQRRRADQGPFNALWPVVDLNNALVSFILTEYAGFTTSAGHVGPYYRVDHDVSLLVPEIWCRMRVGERDPGFLIQHGYLEKLDDFEHDGRTVQASRLGYRITASFVDHFLGRIFETASAVFPEDILRPEKQDLDTFVLGMHSIVEAQTEAARNYFDEGSVDAACPPLKALLHIMAHGHYEGMHIGDPAFRALFTRESVLASDWYRERLKTKQLRDMGLWTRHVAALEAFQASAPPFQSAQPFQPSAQPGIDMAGRLAYARGQCARVNAPAYLEELFGTIGADPFHLQLSSADGK